jgi:hypothetical protein
MCYFIKVVRPFLDFLPLESLLKPKRELEHTGELKKQDAAVRVWG